MPLRVSRRAERFAAALDGDPAVDDAATQRLVGTTARLGALQVAGPARTAAGRAAVVAAAAGTLAEVGRHAAAPAAHAAASTGASAAAPTAAAHVVGHALALKAITGIVALAVIGGGVEVAAQRSLPGQPFYGLKRATEAAQLHVSGSGPAQAKERLDQAKTRLAEIKALWPGRQSSAHSQQIADLVAALDKDIALATRPLLAAGGSAVAELTATVAALQTQLAALPDTLTGSGAAAVASSISTLGSLITAVSGLASLVPGQGPTAVFPAVPTLPVQALPTGPSAVGPTTAPTTPQTSTPGSTTPTTRPTLPVPTVRPSLPTLPSVSLPPLTVPTLSPPPFSVPPISVPTLPIPTAAASGIASAVSCLIHLAPGCLP